VAAACGPGPVVRRGAVDHGALGHVERRLEAVRGLRFTAHVPGRVLDDAEVAALLEREIDREFRPGDLERLAAVYGRLGLLPPGTDLGAVVRALLADQIAALYDPRAKTLSLTAAGLRQRTTGLALVGFLFRRDFLGEVLVAHELTHALQDQHWGLPTSTPPLTAGDGDRIVARRALLEGDASLASVAYLRPGPLDPATVQRFVEQVAVIPEELATRHPEIPEQLRATLAFQYNTGSVFAAAAYLRGGWAAIDAAHGDPPASTEQVLHPAKYFDARDRPSRIVLGGTEALAGRGWTTVVEDTLGELDVRVLAGTGGDPVRAGTIAAGWDGDRLRALARGDEIVVVWLTTWDSDADAGEFADAVPALIAGAWAERRGRDVLVLVGDPARALAPAVWGRSRISRAA
jgi:hypothetical protein